MSQFIAQEYVWINIKKYAFFEYNLGRMLHINALVAYMYIVSELYKIYFAKWNTEFS